MSNSPHLNMPFLAPAQAQKHVTVNEGLDTLDAVVQCAVIEMGRNAPPSDAVDGDRYLVGAAPTGEWAGQAGRFAWFSNGGWAFAAPRAGWRVYDLTTDRLLVRTRGGAWTPLSGGGAPSEIQNATRIGIGATAGAGDPFTAKLNAALWTARTSAEGGSGDLHVKLNKAEAARDAGLMLQTNFVTRAVAGLFGSNRFRLAVSPDGSAFRDAISVDDATGVVSLPQLPRFKAHTNFDNPGQVDVWAKIGINVGEINDQAVFNPATNLFTAPASGVYFLGATLVFKLVNSAGARMMARLVLNGASAISGSVEESTAPHVSEATTIRLQTLAALNAGDTVELQGGFRAFSGRFAANRTNFWGFKVG